MADFIDKRKYKRWANPLCKALVSENGRIWAHCDVSDLSAGGLKFSGGKCFAIGQNIFFRLVIYSGYSEFTIALSAQIVHGREMQYGVKFLDITKDQRIQLDEIVNASLEQTLVTTDHYHKTEDGIYTFFFNPVRRRTLKLRRYI